jgi:hypothetical protein
MEGKYATEYIFYTPLVTAGSLDYITNPTIAAGDFQVSTDGGSWSNLDTLPSLSPAADQQVKITVSIAEMTGKKVAVRAVDAAGAEWEDDFWEISTYGHASAQHVADRSVSIPDQVWDEVLTGAAHNINNSAGKKLRELASPITHVGTAQGSGTGNNQIQLQNTASGVDGAYDPSVVAIIAGTGAGQSRFILDYVGSTFMCTVGRDWKMNPSTDSEYIIVANPGHEHVNEGLAQAGAAGTITLNALASSVDSTYVGQSIFIRSGTGADQAGRVTAYNGTTKVATVTPDWVTTPDSTSGYVTLPDGSPSVTDIDTELTAEHGSGAWTSVAGGGARSVTIQTQEIDTTPISSVVVTVYTDSARTNLFATVNTGVTGIADAIGMNDATYYWAAAKTGVTFTSGSFTVSATSTKTINGTVNTPSLPSAAELCVLFGTIKDATGTVIADATVTAYAAVPQSVSSTQMGNVIATTTTNSSGYFELELIRGATVRVVIAKADINDLLAIPDAASKDLSSYTW